MNADERLYVLAGTYVQFANWCAEHRISPRDRRVRCILSGPDLRGAPQGLWYIRIGTWGERRDLDVIENTLACCGARDASHWVGTARSGSGL